jgi:uncharacterized protein YbjT (DUF2867 family)
MSNVLVTGASGRLGTLLVPELRRRGHTVRPARRSAGEGWFAIDLGTGEGLAEAVDGVDVVVHAASSPYRRTRDVDVLGTRRLVDALGPRVHLVYISIVGVDRSRLAYYRAKYAAEREVLRNAQWTVLRTTQWHPFVPFVIRPLLRLPVVPVPKIPLQPLDVGVVASELADLVDAGPSGRAPDLGGPEVKALPDLVRSWCAAEGLRRWVVAVPWVGAVASGALCTEVRRVGPTWEAWLAAR